MKIHIPKFEPMLKANEHLAHEAFEIDLGENVVEVIRCRDCKNYSGKYCTLTDDSEDRREPDDYCSYGVRKDGEWS